MSKRIKRQIAKGGAILGVVALTGCDSGWKGPRPEPGPLPLSSPKTPITRLVKTKDTFETTYIQVLWDEGQGPVLREQRIKPVVDAVPKELRDRLHLTKTVPSLVRAGHVEQKLHDAWGVVVAVNPDVLIVTVRDLLPGFQNWYETSPRGHAIYQRLENIRLDGPGPGGWDLSILAGTLVPWSEEMYVVSTDSKVKCGRLKFENTQATVLLSDGKLVLRHHDDDVDVSRE